MLFVSSFENKEDGPVHTKHYFPPVEIEDYRYTKNDDFH